VATTETEWLSVRYERHRLKAITQYRLMQDHTAGSMAPTETSTVAKLPRWQRRVHQFIACGAAIILARTGHAD
jgi:hypothetical protein